jgi:hypothetical protein
MNKQKYITPSVIALLITLLALTDALFFKGDKSLSKIVEEISVLILFCLPLLYPKNPPFKFLLNIMLTYIFLRIALFDVFFNIFAGLDVYYLGSTDIWNRLLSNIGLHFILFWTYKAFFVFLVVIIWIKNISNG